MTDQRGDATPRRWDRWDWALALVAGIAMSVGRGFSVYVYDQHYWLLASRRLLNPDWLASDYVVNTVDLSIHNMYLPYIVFQTGLVWLGPFAVTSFMARYVLMTILALSLLSLCKWLCSCPRVAFLGISLAVVLGAPFGTWNLGGIDFFADYLKASAVGGVFAVTGLALLAQERYWPAGLAIALCGLFHAGIYLAFVPVWGAMGLFLLFRRSAGVWPAVFFVVAALGGIPLLLQIAAHQGQAPAEKAAIVEWLVNVRNPMAFRPDSWPLGKYLDWSLWIVVGAVAMTRLPKTPCRAVVWVSFAVTVTVAVVSVAIAYSGQWLTVNLVSPYRASSWAALLAFLAIYDRLSFVLLDEEATFEWPDAIVVVGAALGVFGWAFGSFAESENLASRVAQWVVMLSPLYGFYLARFLAARLSFLHRDVPWGPIAFCLGCLAFALCWYRFQINIQRAGRLLWFLAPVAAVAVGRLVATGDGVRLATARRRGLMVALFGLLALTTVNGVGEHTQNEIAPPDRATAEAWDFLREQTPQDAVVVVSPDNFEIRLAINRALVADGKAGSTKPAVAREYAERISAVCGLSSYGSNEGVRKGYSKLDTERARRLKDEYGATHVVVDIRKHEGDLSGLREVFRNDKWAVYAI